MDIQYNEFVGFYENVYEEGYCEHLIEQFNILQEKGAGANRQKSENIKRHKKDDYQICISLRDHQLDDFHNKNTVDIFFEGLQVCYEDYIEKYSSLTDGKILATTMKMQKTSPGGGYHIWHPEQGNGESARRVLVYMLYLNTLHENCGGETEFLYQKLRIQPKKNLMLLWPASFTHTHRGNLVLTDDYKYIVTGWFYYD